MGKSATQPQASWGTLKRGRKQKRLQNLCRQTGYINRAILAVPQLETDPKAPT